METNKWVFPEKDLDKMKEEALELIYESDSHWNLYGEESGVSMQSKKYGDCPIDLLRAK